MKERGVMSVVHDISGHNVADVPRLLRELADEIEQDGESPRACVVLTEFRNVPLDIRQFGRDGDDMRTLGLLQLATACISDGITQFWFEQGPEPKDAA